MAFFLLLCALSFGGTGTMLAAKWKAEDKLTRGITLFFLAMGAWASGLLIAL